MSLKDRIKDGESFGVGLDVVNKVVGDPRSKLFYSGLCKSCKRLFKKRVMRRAVKGLLGKPLGELVKADELCSSCLLVVKGAGEVFKQ